MKKLLALACFILVFCIGIANADPTGMVWVYINDPGVSGHEGFTGHMSKYETTNAQYTEYLNSAMDDGEITIYDNVVYAFDDSSHTKPYIYPTNVASHIMHSGGTFSVRSRDGYSMANYPVVVVSWHGATAFCNYYGYRLPTEWEWQAVADYDGSYTYGCGTTIDHSKANYDWDNPLNLSYPYTSPVNHYSSYGYGMNDMAGNVREWTSSCWYPDCDPYGYVMRGGGWGRSEDMCRVSYRSSNSNLYYTSDQTGFRVCLDATPSEPEWSFVQISDIHIGACSGEPYVCNSEKLCILWDARDDFVQTLNTIDKLSPRPDFVLVTGDLVQYAEYKDENSGLYQDYIDLLQENLHDIKVYEVPGNHDRYMVKQCINYDSHDLELYHNYITQKRPAGCQDLLAGGDDYVFPHKGFLFIGLDSGEDVSTELLDFRGTGLLSEQMNVLKDPEKVAPSKPKIIFMHHPAFGDPDWSIKEAKDFLEYCAHLPNRVQLVLAGHTHEAHVFRPYGGSYPAFIQTASASLDKGSFRHGYRVIDVRDGLAIERLYTPAERVSKEVTLTRSPVNLHIYDSQTRHTGINEAGGIDRNVPDSFYFHRRTIQIS